MLSARFSINECPVALASFRELSGRGSQLAPMWLELEPDLTPWLRLPIVGPWRPTFELEEEPEPP